MDEKQVYGDAISFRLTDQEREYLGAFQRASGVNRTDLIRMCIRFAFHEWLKGNPPFPAAKPAVVPAAQPAAPPTGNNISINHDSHKKKKGRK